MLCCGWGIADVIVWWVGLLFRKGHVDHCSHVGGWGNEIN